MHLSMYIKRRRFYICMPLLISQLLIVSLLYLSGPWDTFLMSLSLKNEMKPPWMELTKSTISELLNLQEGTVFIQPTTIKPLKTAFAVIYVMSLPNSSERRDEIRDTWKNWGKELNIDIRFFMGTSMNNFSLKKLKEESQIHDDIVVTSFEETYYKLTVKVVQALKFFITNDYNYNQTDKPYFIKTDDDVFINLPNLVERLKLSSTTEFVGGHLFPRPIVNRNVKSKFYMPWSVWNEDYFPAYVGGFCYVISGNLISQLFNTSLKTLYFPFEDMFLTGLVANKKLRLNVTNIEHFYDGASGDLKVLEDNSQLAKAIAITPLEIPHSMRHVYARIRKFQIKTKMSLHID